MTQSKIHVWLDCDPGQDDIYAIILSAKNSKIHLLGISTSAGNSTIQNTTQNALNILHQLNRDDVVVVKGASKPLVGQLSLAGQYHGNDGLGGANLKVSPRKAVQTQPFLEIYKLIKSSSKKVTFINTGSLTNLSILLNAFPELKQKIEEISVMGGAIGTGNITPSAEFNFFLDPIAAKNVLASGIKFTMIPLQVTHTVLATEQIFERIYALNTQLSRKLYRSLRYFQKAYKELQDFDFPPVHDPTAVFYVLYKNEFEGKKAYIKVDTNGESYGRTNCNFRSENTNGFVCNKINVKRFWEQMIRAIQEIKQN